MRKLKTLSVFLKNTGSSQLAFYVIEELNELCKNNPSIDPVVFCENQHKNCIPPNFSIMDMSESWGARGDKIATSLSTAQCLIDTPCSGKKFFYVWDLEWINHSRKVQEYEEYCGIYCNDSIEIISRSDSHKSILENSFNRKINHVIPDFNIDKILEVLKDG